MKIIIGLSCLLALVALSQAGAIALHAPIVNSLPLLHSVHVTRPVPLAYTYHGVAYGHGGYGLGRYGHGGYGLGGYGHGGYRLGYRHLGYGHGYGYGGYGLGGKYLG